MSLIIFILIIDKYKATNDGVEEVLYVVVVYVV